MKLTHRLVWDYSRKSLSINHWMDWYVDSCSGLYTTLLSFSCHSLPQPLPENIFVVATCNPHRGDSLTVLMKPDTWVNPLYYVRQLHPTLDFIKWDYGSLDKHQEKEYICVKMKMLEKKKAGSDRMDVSDIPEFADLISDSQELVRSYALEHLVDLHVGIPEPETYSRCCVSQRDIQRVFTFSQKLKSIYDYCTPHGNPEEQDYNRRAVLVSLGIVYYMRLNSHYRKEFARFLDKRALLCKEATFTEAFNDALDWFVNEVWLPKGIAKTQALKENLFAVVLCTMTNTPLVITGAPGSSKTLSFNLALSNLRGQESKSCLFRNTDLFQGLDPHFYQCSRRTTTSEIERIFLQAANRQESHAKVQLPIRCVVFMDEAGLPQAKHEALKVLHSWLDKQVVSFVAITNHILDAAKTNRAVSLFRPEHSLEDLKLLAKECACPEPNSPLRDDMGRIDILCQHYHNMMSVAKFNKFFGLRDFVHFVNHLRRRTDRGATIDNQLILESLERNFSGTEYFHEIASRFLKHVRCYLTKCVDNKLTSWPVIYLCNPCLS